MENINMGLFHFKVLFEIMHNLPLHENENDLAKYLIEKLVSSMNTEGGTIFKLASKTKLIPMAAVGATVEQLQTFNFEVGKGVVGWAIQNNQPVKVENPLGDPRFYKDVDLNTGFNTRSIIAVPIVARGKVLGAIELLNRKTGPFVNQDLEFITIVGRECGDAIEHLRLMKTLEYKERFQEALITSLSSGLIVVDTEGKLVEINPYAKKILGMEKVEINDGMYYSEALKDCCGEFLMLIEQVKTFDRPQTRKEIILIIGGEKKLIGYSGVPIRDSANNVIGSAVLFQDITHLMKA